MLGWACWPGCLIACLLAAPVGGGEFRVVTRIYRDDRPQPIAENLSIFLGDSVWDIAADGSTLWFDPARGTLRLLDPARGVQTEISTVRIELGLSQLRQQLRDEAARRGAPRLAFYAEPRFEIRTAGEETTFTHAAIRYRVQLRGAPDEATSRQYLEFLDWSTRLAALQAPHLLARLPVNAHLAQQRRIPQQVELEWFDDSGPGQRPAAVFRSEHEFTWGLGDSDRRRVADLARLRDSLRMVEYREYAEPRTVQR
jgi:hypothetical protein